MCIHKYWLRLRLLHIPAVLTLTYFGVPVYDVLLIPTLRIGIRRLLAGANAYGNARLVSFSRRLRVRTHTIWCMPMCIFIADWIHLCAPPPLHTSCALWMCIFILIKVFFLHNFSSGQIRFDSYNTNVEPNALIHEYPMRVSMRVNRNWLDIRVRLRCYVDANAYHFGYGISLYRMHQRCIWMSWSTAIAMKKVCEAIQCEHGEHTQVAASVGQWQNDFVQKVQGVWLNEVRIRSFFLPGNSSSYCSAATWMIFELISENTGIFLFWNHLKLQSKL